MNIEPAEALHTLGKLMAHEMPEVAIKALERGFDGQSIRELAGLNNPTMSEACPLFTKTLREAGRRKLTLRDAGIYLAKEIAEEIIAERVGLYDGARQIWGQVSEACKDVPVLGEFENLADDYEVHEFDGQRPQIAKEIVRAAHKFLALPRPPVM